MKKLIRSEDFKMFYHSGGNGFPALSGKCGRANKIQTIVYFAIADRQSVDVADVHDNWLFIEEMSFAAYEIRCNNGLAVPNIPLRRSATVSAEPTPRIFNQEASRYPSKYRWGNGWKPLNCIGGSSIRIRGRIFVVPKDPKRDKTLSGRRYVSYHLNGWF